MRTRINIVHKNQDYVNLYDIPLRRGMRSDNETATQEQSADVIDPIRFMANCIVAIRASSQIGGMSLYKRRLTIETNALINIKVEVACIRARMADKIERAKIRTDTRTKAVTAHLSCGDIRKLLDSILSSVSLIFKHTEDSHYNHHQWSPSGVFSRHKGTVNSNIYVTLREFALN